MGSKILYIEDNPDNLLLVQRVLRSRGHEVVWAKTGEEGISMAEKNRPNLILLDINLPDIDGYEVARRLRSHQDDALAQVTIMAITANALKGDAEKAIASGCNGYMSKPINIRELMTRIDNLLTAG